MRVLSLGNYPIAQPRHGGQLRVRALADRLLSAGWQVRYFCVFDPNAYPEVELHLWNRGFTQDALNDLERRQLRSDFFAAEALFADPELNTIVSGMTLFDPQIIEVEHPWLWPLAKCLLEVLPAAKLVYSSHNVETKLAEEAVRLAPAHVRRETLARVETLERELLQRADLTIAVSQADAEHFRTLTHTVVVFGNGISRPSAPVGLDYWAQKFGPTRYALFVGSAHPPNAIGLARMLGPSLGFLSPVERVMVVGGVSNILNDVEEYTRNKAMMACRMELLGVQNEGGLATMLQLARCVILPITEGGGSNLKTAEALLSGKPIVATSVAFRGFETFMNLARVQICDDPAAFKATLARVLRDDTALEAQTDGSDVSAVLWDTILEDLPKTFQAFLTVAKRPAKPLRLNSKNGFGGVLRRGWHPPDQWGAWSNGQEATIELPVHGNHEIYVLACVANPTGPQRLNRLTIWAGALLLFERDFGPHYDEQEIRFTVKPPDAGKGDTIWLKARASFMVQPSEHGQLDARSLGFGLRHLIVSFGDRAQNDAGSLL